MNPKKIFSIIALILATGILVVLFSGHKNNFSPTVSSTPLTAETIKENNLPAKISNQTKSQTPAPVLPAVSDTPKDVAWAVFQKYLAYNKSHDLAGVKNIVYKISPVCAGTIVNDECKNRMDSAYSYGSSLKKDDFTNVWHDSKQTILATDFKIQEDSNMIGRNRAIIFFINDGTSLKMLNFNPLKGVAINKGAASEQELNDRIIIYTEDKDQDGLADYQEECLGLKEGEICTKTDPKLRDTNNNGWWDGVEALMK
jgi:hypothetical protein